MSDAIQRALLELEAKRDQLISAISVLRSLGPTTMPNGRSDPANGHTHRPKRGRPPRKLLTQPPPKRIPDASAEHEDVDNASGPMSDAGVRVGKTLVDPFSPTDLRARMDNPKLAYSWIYAWQQKGWVENSGYGQYRKTDKFGVRA